MTNEEMTNRFSLMTHSFCKYSFDYCLDCMEEYGLKHVDLTGCYPHFPPMEANAERIGKIRNKIRERGMDIVCYNPENLGYPYNIASIDPTLRKASVEYMIMNLHIASELCSPMMMLCAGWGCLDQNREEALKCAAGSLSEIADEAEKFGIELLVEHLTVQSSNLLNYSWQVKDMIEKVNSAYLNCLLDLGQMSVFGEQPKVFFDTMGKKVRHIHIMDGDPNCHLAFGDGILPLKSYYKEAIECGYTGLFSLEINDGRYAEIPYEAHKKCIEDILRW